MNNETNDTSGLVAPAGSLRELLHVAFPLMVSAGSLSIMNVVDRAFLAMLHVDALAASMPSSMMLWTLMSLPFGIAGYTNAFAAQYEGAGNRERVAAALWQGLLVATIGGFYVVPFYFLAESLFAAADHTPEVQRLEVEYFRWLMVVAFPLLYCTVFSSFFAARKETHIVMYVNVTTSLLNGVLDYMLIFGYGFIPAFGMKGAAIGTVIAQSVSAIMYVFLVWRRARQTGYPFKTTCRIDGELLGRMLRYGFPNGVQSLLDVGAFTMFLILVGKLGTQQQAATNLAFTLNSLAFVPMLGMGTAVLTLVGRRIGEEKPELASRTVWNAMLLSSAYMILFAVIYLTLPKLILTPFLHSHSEVDFESIEPIVIQLLRFVAVYTLFDAMAIVFGSAIRGAGETRFSMIFTVTSGWCIMVMPTMWAIHYGKGLYICWTAATAFIIVLGTGFLIRFLQGNWKDMQLTEDAHKR